jgi:hypothetical protein
MAEEYRVKVRKVTEIESIVTVNLSDVFGDSTDLVDKAVYRRAAEGSLSTDGKQIETDDVSLTVVSVYRGDVRVYPRARTLKPTKDKPVTPKEEAPDAGEPS